MNFNITVKNLLLRSVLVNLGVLALFCLLAFVFTSYWQDVARERSFFMKWFGVSLFLGIFGFVSSLISHLIVKDSKGKVFLLGGTLFSLAFLTLIYGVCRDGFEFGSRNTEKKEIAQSAPTPTPAANEPIIQTKTGSTWHQDTSNTEKYYHVIGRGESLEYVFNNIQTSLEAARQQNITIYLKAPGTGELIQVLPKDFQIELWRGTRLYSGSEVGDTVWLTYSQLEKFKREKNR